MEKSDLSQHIIDIAMNSIQKYLENNTFYQLPVILPHELKQKSACFVSLKSESILRGCIGTIEPVYSFLAKEIQNNAISAATRDPRFPPLSLDEFNSIECSVDVLMPSFKIWSISELDPVKYGVIVEKGTKRGVLLPNIDGVNEVKQQLSIAAQKAGINLTEDPNIYAFEVERFKQ